MWTYEPPEGKTIHMKVVFKRHVRDPDGNLTKILKFGCDAIHTDAGSVHCVVEGEGGEVYPLDTIDHFTFLYRDKDD